MTRRAALLFFLIILGLVPIIGTDCVFDLLPVNAHAIPAAHPASQLILVVGKRWSSDAAVLKRYERDPATQHWVEVGKRYKVSIGEKGFAWGIGQHDETDLAGPKMDEGDMRTPAGMFPITGAFGYQKENELTGLHVPYTQIFRENICVDDPESKHYNRIISTAKVPRSEWNSGEPMFSEGSGYKLAILFAQNPEPSVSRRGSCLYIHIGATNGGTFGCTTLGEDELREIVMWLDIEKHPLLVQLPEPVLREVATKWDLPTQ